MLLCACVALEIGTIQAPAAPAAPIDRATAARVGASSYANVRQVRVSHISLDLTVDFTASRLHGTADLGLQRVDPRARELVLDTRDLRIREVQTASVTGSWAQAKFSVGPRDSTLGAPLRIQLGENTERVRVHYATVPSASGLQWLKPEQTGGKRHPFLYTQSQPIHARSWIPLQDTPYVRATFDARVRVANGLRVAMGAKAGPPEAPGVWVFAMPEPVPSYLIALAAGDIDFRATGARTGVYAERAMLEAATTEFAETEQTLQSLESMYGPYRWERYDILVLPPSFPYGGMENPRVTFATPTVITGDRMLISLVFHEVAHSWSGNLVTNATWSDFWLNEGFTQYLTYRLLEARYGEARANMERVRGLQELREEMARLRKAEWPLVSARPLRDPERNLGNVPYERGALFLTWLEQRAGRPEFDRFLRGWFDSHAFAAVTTAQFVSYLQEHLRAQSGGEISQSAIEAWLYKPELPPFAVLPRSEALAQVDAERSAWIKGLMRTEELSAARWTVHEWEHFLGAIPPSVPFPRLRSIDELFKLSETSNAILASAWFRVALRCGYKPALPAIERYLMTVGRMKLIVPLYRELARSAAGRAFAVDVYARAKDFYHPITRNAVEAALKPKRRNAT